MVSAPGANTGAREYAVADLTAGTTYDIVLFDADNVDVDDDGVVTFADEENANNDATVEGNNQADQGTVAAVVEQINGEAVVPASAVEGVAASDGTLTFLIDAIQPDSVIPVVFVDGFDGTDTNTTADDNNALDLDADNAPLDEEPFGIGGQKTWTAGEAADNQPTNDQTVSAVDEANNVFVTGTGASSLAYFYEGEDTYFVDGTQVSQAVFERELSSGDTLLAASEYFNEGDAETVNDGPSTFRITDVTPAVPTNVDANRTADSTARVTWTDNTDADDVEVFNVYRTTLTTASPNCPATLAGYTLVGQVEPDAGTAAADMFDDTGLQPATSYCYVVTAVLDGDESAFEATDGDNQTTTLGAGQTAEPQSIDAFVLDDAADDDAFATEGTVTAGDDWRIVFDEALAELDGTNEVFRVQDADGDIADIDCNASSGTVNNEATCVLNDGTVTIDGTEYDDNEVLTVTFAADLTLLGGTGDDVLEYPLTVTQAVGFADADADAQWTPADDPDNVIDDEGDKTFGGTGAFDGTATATDAGYTDEGTTPGFGNDAGDAITVTYDETGVLVGDGDTVLIDADGAGSGAATTYTCQTVADDAGEVTCVVAGNTLTVTATGTTGTVTVITLGTSTVAETGGITDADGNSDNGFPEDIDA